MQWSDGKPRCAWANPANPRYLAYHDAEWGVPVHDDQKLFEMLVLEAFQAGLSWECVLNKRAAFAAAFDNFDIARVAAYQTDKLEALSRNPGIIRNRRKIQAAVTNAQVFAQIQREWGGFANYLWHWTNGCTLYETGQSRSPLSDEISRDLKRRGMKFTGSVMVYAYLQAVGVLNSHEPDCYLYKGSPAVR